MIGLVRIREEQASLNPHGGFLRGGGGGGVPQLVGFTA